MAKAEERTEFGLEIEAGLREALAWKRGEIALPTRVVRAMPAQQVKTIRKAVAKSPREFERRFGVPARTLEGWEQGRNIDLLGRILLTLIEHEPETIERILATAQAAGASDNPGRGPLA